MMLKKYMGMTILVFLVISLLFSSDSSGAQTSAMKKHTLEKLAKDVNRSEIEDNIGRRLSDYNYDLSSAINGELPGLLDKHIRHDTELYGNQKKLVENLYNEGTKVYFLAGMSNRNSIINNDNNIMVEVFEKHGIFYLSGKTEIVDNFYVYKISNDGLYQLLSIEKGHDFFAENGAPRNGRVNANNLDVRASAGRNALSLANVHSGDTVQIINVLESEGEIWLRIKHPEIGYAYVLAQYIDY